MSAGSIATRHRSRLPPNDSSATLAWAPFTPPELQQLSSFKGVTRTPNHDNFGLAGTHLSASLHGGGTPSRAVFRGQGDMPPDRAISPNPGSRTASPSRAALRWLRPPHALKPVAYLAKKLAMPLRNSVRTAFSRKGQTDRPTMGFQTISAQMAQWIDDTKKTGGMMNPDGVENP